MPIAYRTQDPQRDADLKQAAIDRDVAGYSLGLECARIEGLPESHSARSELEALRKKVATATLDGLIAVRAAKCDPATIRKARRDFVMEWLERIEAGHRVATQRAEECATVLAEPELVTDEQIDQITRHADKLAEDLRDLEVAHAVATGALDELDPLHLVPEIESDDAVEDAR